jgi:hypothetical protein
MAQLILAITENTPMQHKLATTPIDRIELTDRKELKNMIVVTMSNGITGTKKRSPIIQSPPDEKIKRRYESMNKYKYESFVLLIFKMFHMNTATGINKKNKTKYCRILFK